MQVTGVLDDCFFYEGPLGVSLPPASDTLSISLWAPTAQVGAPSLTQACAFWCCMMFCGE